MTKRMLIDATHAEETRVVVLDGNRLEDFDVETSTKRQLKGNIYLAKVIRVEPSLQAAFVEYGGNRHGFLAFSEIHPDYYQIPIADRQRLLDMQAEEARREEEEEDLELALSQAAGGGDHPTSEASPEQPALLPAETRPEPAVAPEAWATPAMPLLIKPEVIVAAVSVTDDAADVSRADDAFGAPLDASGGDATETAALADDGRRDTGVEEPVSAAEAWALPHTPRLLKAEITSADDNAYTAYDEAADDADFFDSDAIDVLPPPETVGGGDQDSGDEPRERRMPPRFMRNYKIQEVIRRRQILLVQVVKEERGTKGAALTTYLSLAGRFGVLMPNSPRGGGISRKITSATDRRRLKEVMQELDIPRGMGMIVRTAGANRPKPEIKRDCEYLLRLWDDIREHTMKSVAPALIYEEASLIKRTIRDVYSRDIDEIMVDGEEGWRAAHDFMRMLMPSHAKKVQLWRDGGQPLFAKHQVEAQLDAMLSPTVQLRSGGYLVINQAEALVAIDVNSGRSTRERNIEETALRTNLEAADEVARQLRLRDLAGLIVIDFIDMESKRHNAMVERRIKEALKNDRARIQVGHISHFGLLEMSRQRLRPSLAETSFIACPHCGGTGHVRSTESAAIHVLRGIEDEGGKRRSAEIIVHVATPIALYLLNHKRERLREIETQYAMRVIIAADDAQIAPQYRIERVRVRTPEEAPPVVTPDRMLAPAPSFPDDVEEDEDVETVANDDDNEQDDDGEESPSDASGNQNSDDAERRRKRRRRRRRGGRRDDQADAAGDTREAGDEGAAPESEGDEPADAIAAEAPTGTAETGEAAEGGEATEALTAEAAAAEEEARNRRRGRRGGRRRRRDDGELSPYAQPGAEQPEIAPVYAGPTPADPFGGRAFDIFDVMDQVERAAEIAPSRAEPLGEIVNSAAPEPASEPEPVTAPSAISEPASPAVVAEPTVSAGAVDAQAEIVNTGAADAVAETLAPTSDAAPTPAAETVAEIVAPAAVEVAQPESAAAVPAGPDAMDANQAADGAGQTTPEPEVVPEVASEPVSAPVIKPIVIGSEGEAPAARKRGWWRRG